MQVSILIDSTTTPAQLANIAAAVEALGNISRPLATLESTGDVFGDRTLILPPVAKGESEALLAKLEAENPQFGKQPLPKGATSAEGAGPLAPPSAPTPAAAAPSTNAPAAAPGSSAAVDKNGLPWDERIHASSRAKIADGSWRMKRGVQSHVVEAVEAELRAQMGFVGQSGSTVAFDAAPTDGASVPPPPAAPAAAPLPPGPPALTFGIVASRIGKAVTAGTLSGNVLSVKLAQLGFPDGLHTVNARPDMWQKVLDTLGA